MASSPQLRFTAFSSFCPIGSFKFSLPAHATAEYATLLPRFTFLDRIFSRCRILTTFCYYLILLAFKFLRSSIKKFNTPNRPGSASNALIRFFVQRFVRQTWRVARERSIRPDKVVPVDPGGRRHTVPERQGVIAWVCRAGEPKCAFIRREHRICEECIRNEGAYLRENGSICTATLFLCMCIARSCWFLINYLLVIWPI